MSSPLEAFAGLLDRSVQEIAALSADGRSFDGLRIGQIADIWDNNTVPLVSVACAPRPLRAGRARDGLRWMADLGADRRALVVSLDPALDTVLPAAEPGRAAYRDYLGRVRPGAFPVTARTIAELLTDYDLEGASVRSLTVRPGEERLRVDVALAAVRRFCPGEGRVAPDGSTAPWPAAPLRFTFDAVTDIRFDAANRTGLAVSCEGDGVVAAIGCSGGVRAATASVWPDDPCWYESAAGRVAEAVTPHDHPERHKPAHSSSLTADQRDAAAALVHLMTRIRLVAHYPELAADVPVADLCHVAGNAGGAILAAAAHHGPARQRAFANLSQRWRRLPPDRTPTPIPAGTAMLRYVGYRESHQDEGVRREGSAVLIAAVPDRHPAASWRLAATTLIEPAQFSLASTTFDTVQLIHANDGAFTISDVLAVKPR